MKIALYLLAPIATMVLGCHVKDPQPGWHIKNDTVCFRDAPSALSWKRCSTMDEDRKTYCRARVFVDRYGFMFEPTPVEVFFHAPSGLSKVKILNGEHHDMELYCPTEQVRK